MLISPYVVQLAISRYNESNSVHRPQNMAGFLLRCASSHEPKFYLDIYNANPKNWFAAFMEHGNKWSDRTLLGSTLDYFPWALSPEGRGFWVALILFLRDYSHDSPEASYWRSFSDKDHMQVMLDSRKDFSYPHALT